MSTATNSNPFLGNWGFVAAVAAAKKAGATPAEFHAATQGGSQPSTGLPGTGISAFVARRANQVGAAPTVEDRSYGGMNPVAYGTRGRNTEALATASMAAALAHAQGLDLDAGRTLN